MQQTVTAKELKNHTGEVLRRVRGGATVVITNRGRPVAVLAPPSGVLQGLAGEPSTLQEIWADISATLAACEPGEPSWQQAMAKARGRR
ncbi:MAG: type II toxin-antitoxin system prevent-host-death family antitoxin [Myxococcales bacterium]|nr:type II toxin-antitoxin system prevent-host-death family antitoxin [Myxococcales bacterium]